MLEKNLQAMLITFCFIILYSLTTIKLTHLWGLKKVAVCPVALAAIGIGADKIIKKRLVKIWVVIRTEILKPCLG